MENNQVPAYHQNNQVSPDAPAHGATPPSSAPSQNTSASTKKNNKLIIIIAIILLVLIIGVVIYFLVSRSEEEIFIVTERVEEKELLSNDEKKYHASDILNWLETQKDDRGTYMTLNNCERDPETRTDVCVAEGVSNRTGQAVIWANYQYWKATGDERALQRTKDALAIYADRNIVELIQTDQLNCYYMAPIFLDENSLLTAQDRQNASAVCLDGTIETYYVEPFPDQETLSQEINAKINAIVNNEVYDDSNDHYVSDNFNFTSTIPDTNETISIWMGDQWGDYATDTYSKYTIDNDPNTLHASQFFFSGALTNYLVHGSNQQFNLGCDLLLASRSMCDIDSQYCDFADELENTLVDMNISNEAISFTSTAKCVLASKDQKQHFMDIIESYYLSQDNTINQTNNPGLLNDYNSISKSIVTNALFAGVLIEE